MGMSMLVGLRVYIRVCVLPKNDRDSRRTDGGKCHFVVCDTMPLSVNAVMLYTYFDPATARRRET